MKHRSGKYPDVADNQYKQIASLADELKKLADLRGSGILTNDEFQIQKKILLNSQSAIVKSVLSGEKIAPGPSPVNVKKGESSWYNSKPFNFACIVLIIALLIFTASRLPTGTFKGFSDLHVSSRPSKNDLDFSSEKMVIAFAEAGVKMNTFKPLGYGRMRIPPSKYERKILADGVRRILKDPTSAIFTWDDHIERLPFYCGYVNSKNAFGGYVGNSRVYVLVDKTGKYKILGLVPNPFMRLTVDQVFIEDEAEKRCG